MEVNEANENNLLVTALLTSDTDKEFGCLLQKSGNHACVIFSFKSWENFQ